MGLSEWESAKDVILRELAGASGERQIEMARRNDGVYPTPVFFVRVANKGVMLDVARKSGKCET